MPLTPSQTIVAFVTGAYACIRFLAPAPPISGCECHCHREAGDTVSPPTPSGWSTMARLEGTFAGLVVGFAAGAAAALWFLSRSVAQPERRLTNRLPPPGVLGWREH